MNGCTAVCMDNGLVKQHDPHQYHYQEKKAMEPYLFLNSIVNESEPFTFIPPLVHVVCAEASDAVNFRVMLLDKALFISLYLGSMHGNMAWLSHALHVVLVVVYRCTYLSHAGTDGDSSQSPTPLPIPMFKSTTQNMCLSVNQD